MDQLQIQHGLPNMQSKLSKNILTAKIGLFHKINMEYRKIPGKLQNSRTPCKQETNQPQFKNGNCVFLW